MILSIRVSGIDKVLKALHAELEQIKNRAETGLIEAGLLVQRSSQQKTPVRYNKLKTSAFTVWSGGHSGNIEGVDIPANLKNKNRIKVIVGHSAAYAVFVHENLKARHRVGQAKFLERALSENSSKIALLVKKAI